MGFGWALAAGYELGFTSVTIKLHYLESRALAREKGKRDDWAARCVLAALYGLSPVFLRAEMAIDQTR